MAAVPFSAPAAFNHRTGLTMFVTNPRFVFNQQADAILRFVDEPRINSIVLTKALL
jgi:hypothetical protein